MEPGASKPKPGGDPMAPMSDAEVEKTLSTLESMTSTLVKEVGTPPNRAAKAQAHATATAATPEPTPPEVEANPAPAAAPTPADPAPTARDSATEPSAPPAPADQVQPAPAEPAVSAETEPVAAPAEPNTEPAASADAEVEQEISQAIRQLRGGQPAPAAATTAPAAATPAPAGASILRRIFRSLTRAAGAILSPLAMLALLLDPPFRWMPAALKHLLGYVAVGTAVMAAALWYYIIAIRPH